MENSSGEVVFVLVNFRETKTSKQIYFSISLFTYIFTVFLNVTLIMTILMEKKLHKPMHIFLCSLCVNGIYGATGFYPKFLIDLLSEAHRITYSACMTQMFVIYTYVLCEFTNLTVMAYDRYTAICKPLAYHSIMTSTKVAKLLLLSWLFPFSEIFIGIILTIRLPICGFTIDRLYCTNWDIVKLSCIDVSANNSYASIVTVTHIAQAVLIVISYIQIIRTCLGCQAQQQKFMETCLPHLITLINFTVSLAFDVIQARFHSSSSLQAFRNILSVEYLVVPPLLNPLLYGLKLSQIRRSVWWMFKTRINVLK